MIESLFKHPYTLRNLRGGVTGPHIDAIASSLVEQGYSADYTRRLLGGVAHLGNWLEMRRFSLVALDEGIPAASMIMRSVLPCSGASH